MAGRKNRFGDVHHRIVTPWKRDLLVNVRDGAIVQAAFVPQRRGASRSAGDALLTSVEQQVHAYFKRRLKRFDLPLQPFGTPFAQSVWTLTAGLAFGEFVSYGDLARAIGRPFSHRGVARAMAATPIALLIPAHRVVGSDGRLRGARPDSMRARLAQFERTYAIAARDHRTTP